jgi:hypothetical protein
MTANKPTTDSKKKPLLKTGTQRKKGQTTLRRDQPPAPSPKGSQPMAMTTMARPKGMPRAEYHAIMSGTKGRKARFLDFNIHTTNTNSGAQMYGAGQEMKGARSARRQRNVGLHSAGAWGQTVGSNEAVVRPQKHRVDTVTLRNEEYIGVVSGAGADTFAAEGYAVQPANPTIFPWLSQIAGLYQKYRFRHLAFWYRPLVGVFDGSATQGRVGLAMDMDALADDLPNITAANLLDPNVSGVLTQTLELPIDTRHIGPRYCRTGVTPPGSDIKSYDAGKLFFFSYDTSDTDQIGELHVEYEVELIGPVLEVVGATVANNHVCSWSNLATAVAVTGAYVAAPLGTAHLTGYPVTNVSGELQLQPAVYRVSATAEIGITGGIIYTYKGAFFLDNVQMTISDGFPTMEYASGANDAATHTIAVDHVFRINVPQTLSWRRGVTVSAGTAACIDTLTLQVIEA